MDISNYCIAADRMLAFKGVEFDTRYAPYHDRQEVLKATGQDYVPTLIWEGKPVMWYDIPDFLEKARPKPTLYPWGQKGLAVTLEHWGHQVLEERVWRYVVTNVPPVLRVEYEHSIFDEIRCVIESEDTHVLLSPPSPQGLQARANQDDARGRARRPQPLLPRLARSDIPPRLARRTPAHRP